MTNSKSKMLLTHTADVFQIEISNMTAAQVCEAIAEEGYKMGSTSLRNLLSGKCKTTCGFELVEVESSETEAAPVIIEEVKNIEVAPVAIEEAAPATIEVVKEVKEVAANGAKPLRRGTKTDLMFKALCKGATISELCEQFKWTVGAVSSVVYYEPKNKGYDITKEKIEGRGNVIFLTLNGTKVQEESILYTK